MIEVQCSRCEALIDADDALAGKIIPCPACDADVSVPVPASSQVIEVHAEALDDEAEAVLYEGDPFFNPNEQQPAGEDQIWGRNVHIQRMGNGSGCCTGGCLLVAVVIFFTIYGVISFFTG